MNIYNNVEDDKCGCMNEAMVFELMGVYGS